MLSLRDVYLSLRPSLVCLNPFSRLSTPFSLWRSGFFILLPAKPGYSHALRTPTFFRCMRRERAGDVLAEENVTQERLYLVMEGELEVSKGGTEIATVRAGEFAGEVNPKYLTGERSPK